MPIIDREALLFLKPKKNQGHKLKTSEESKHVLKRNQRAQRRRDRIAASFAIKTPRVVPRKLADVVHLRMKTEHPCLCMECKWQHTSKTRMISSKKLVKYTCPKAFYCQRTFVNFVDYLNHQLHHHGFVLPACPRVRAELNDREDQRGPIPPLTVYIAQQYLFPQQLPAQLMTLQHLHQVKEIWKHQLLQQGNYQGEVRAMVKMIAEMFEFACSRIESSTQQQEQSDLLRIHWQEATQFYNSSLVHSFASPSAQDTSSQVGIGKNWLLLDREDPREFRVYELEQDEASGETATPLFQGSLAQWYGQMGRRQDAPVKQEQDIQQQQESASIEQQEDNEEDEEQSTESEHSGSDLEESEDLLKMVRFKNC